MERAHSRKIQEWPWGLRKGFPCPFWERSVRLNQGIAKLTPFHRWCEHGRNLPPNEWRERTNDLWACRTALSQSQRTHFHEREKDYWFCPPSKIRALYLCQLGAKLRECCSHHGGAGCSNCKTEERLGGRIRQRGLPDSQGRDQVAPWSKGTPAAARLPRTQALHFHMIYNNQLLLMIN